MGFHSHEITNPPCPQCGKPGGAVRGFSGYRNWSTGRMVTTCSEACGDAFDARLRELHRSPEYRAAVEAKRAAEDAMRELEEGLRAPERAEPLKCAHCGDAVEWLAGMGWLHKGTGRFPCEPTKGGKAAGSVFRTWSSRDGDVPAGHCNAEPRE